MTAVMANNKYANHFIVNETKQDRIWKAVREAATDAFFDNGILEWVCTNPCDRRIYLRSEVGAEAISLLVVIRDGSIKIRYGKRVIFNLHSEPLPVRLKNSA